MPVLIPEAVALATAALEAAGVSATLAATIASVTVTAVEVAAVAGVAALLLETPSPPGMRITVRQTTPPRRAGVGTARVGGALLLDWANASNDLYRVVAFTDGPIAVSRYYLSQDQVWLYSGDTPTVALLPNGGYPSDCASIYTAFGVAGTPSFPHLTSVTGGVWSSACSATGIFVGALICYGGAIQNFQAAYPRGVPQLNVVGDLGVFYDWRDDTQSQADPTTWKWTANPIVGLVHTLWTLRGYSWALDFLPTLDILTEEANYCDAQTPVLNVFTRAAIYVTVGQDYVLVDPTGPVPPIGVTIYLGGEQFTVTGNAGTTVVDNYTGIKITLSGSLETGIGIGSLIRWQATTEAPITEPTYTANGAWNKTEAESKTVQRFLDAMDGWMMRRGSDGAMIIRCGHYVAPTTSPIRASEIISYSWQDFCEAGKVYNYVTPYVTLPALNYNQCDTSPQSNDADIEINGQSNKDFKPDFVTSNGQVERLAWRLLTKLLLPVQTVKCKVSAMRQLGQRFIGFAADDVGMPAELAGNFFEVVGSPEFVDNGMAITFAIRLVDPATIDVWDCYTQEGDGPAATAPGVPAQLAVTAPTITNISSFTQLETEGGAPVTGERLAVSVSPPAAYAATPGLTWYLQWMVEGGNSWVPAGPFTGLAAGGVVIDTGFVPTGQTLLVQAQFVTGGGLYSPWSVSASPGAALVTPGGLDIELPGGAGHVDIPS